MTSTIRPASKPSKVPSIARFASSLRGYRMLDDYDPFRFQMRPEDPAITLPGGSSAQALLCHLLCRRVWVLAIENAIDEPIKLDRWDLFSAVSDLSFLCRNIPTTALVRAVADAAEFFGLERHVQA